MPEEIEVETRELQEAIEELHEQRREQAESERKAAWTRYIALSTAFLAVFAAIGALQSGTLVNEAMILQLKASDKWNEYQAARQKDHLYTVQAFSLLDRGIKLPPTAAELASVGGGPGENARPAEGAAAGGHPASAHALHALTSSPGGKNEQREKKEKKEKKEWKVLLPGVRLRQYVAQADKEARKEKGLREEAEAFEQRSEHLMHLHHRFAQSVAFIQVAIALSAIAALTRIKSVWALSLLVGLIGIALFAMGIGGQ